MSNLTNAIRHGLTSKTLILQNENPDRFAEMLNAYFAYLKPANQIEIDLSADMVAARWRLRRIWRYETAMLDIEMDFQAPDFENASRNTTRTCVEARPSWH